MLHVCLFWQPSCTGSVLWFKNVTKKKKAQASTQTWKSSYCVLKIQLFHLKNIFYSATALLLALYRVSRSEGWLEPSSQSMKTQSGRKKRKRHGSAAHASNILHQGYYPEEGSAKSSCLISNYNQASSTIITRLYIIMSKFIFISPFILQNSPVR